MHIKICGITNLEDAMAAVAAGADALGFVFYAPSPRYVKPETAAEIVARLPPFVTTVGLFVDESAEAINDIVLRCQLDRIQLHGSEPRSLLSQLKRPCFKALRMKPELTFEQIAGEWLDAGIPLLLDAYQKGVPGGTGESFDWQRIPEQWRSKIVLAGGLDPSNVAEAVKSVSPYAVDVSGGVERGKGVKDQCKMFDFVRNARIARLA